MKSAYRWKLLLGLGLIAFLAACAPKRKETQFSKNKEAEAGQTYTEDQLRAALGSDRYDALVMGIGAANLNLLSYGIGISNMTALINGISAPGKLVSLMSDGPNSRKLTAINVLELLNKLDSACQQPGSYVNPNLGQNPTGLCDTLGKMVNMINGVTVAGMEGIKNIVHGVQDQPLDLNGSAYQNGVSRLALLISLLNENLSVMPTLVNDLAAPRCSNATLNTETVCASSGGIWQSAVGAWSSTSGVCLFPEHTMQTACVTAGHSWAAGSQAGNFSSVGNAKLVRLVNLSYDMRDLAVIINGTTNISNITAVMSGLTGNIFCSRPQYNTQSSCTSAGATWRNTVCSNPAHNTRAACVAAGATWSSDGIDNMSRIINELDRVCDTLPGTHKNGTACIGAGGVWHTKASKIPVIVNNITVVSNMFNIVNGLSNDGRRPPWPTGLPEAYPGDAGNDFDGVDSMVATLNTINVPSMGDPASANVVPFGLNGVKRLAYLVNNLEVAGTPENDSSFDDTTGGYDCTAGNFNNQVNWAFSDNNRSTGGPSWTTQGVVKQAGACALASDGTAASAPTIANPVDNRTQTAELIVNLTSDGSVDFQTNSANLGAGDVVRFFINDQCQNCGSVWTNADLGWRSRSYSIASGLRRLRWDVHRAPGSAGRFYLDSVTLPGTKGAARTAAQKTAIMMNNLYINSSLTNVADLLNAVTTTAVPAASCWSNTPITCTASNNNGLDALAYVVNRAEYPGGAAGTGIISAVTMSGTTVTWNTHNLAIGTAVKFSTTGTLPSPLLPTDVYYVAAAPAPTATTFSIASAPGGSAITLTGGSGSHTAISLPRLAVTVNQIGSISEMKDILNSMGSVSSFQQLVSMMDFIRTPGNIPALINFLSTGGGAKTAQILSNISAAGTSNMLRMLEDVSNGGAPIADVAALINGATTTGHVGNILTELSLSGNTSIAGTETYFASPTGGMKLAQFFNQVNTKAAAAPVQDCAAGPSPINSNFCIKNHIVRLVNDIAPPAVTNGATTIAQIVGGMRPDAGPGGNTGVVRMVNVLYDLKTMNATTYPNALSNATADTYGRLTALIADMGGVGGTNVARMVNELTDNTVTPANSYLLTRLAYIVKNVNRIRYLSRLMSELTNVDLMIALLNDPTTNMVRIDTLVDRQGDLTYGVSPTGDPSPKYGANPSGAGCNVAGCDVSTSDKLGRLIVLINQVTAITNVIKVVNQTYDLNFLSSSTDTFSYGAASKTDGSGFGFINAVTRITSLSNLMNGVTNIDLLINILNGDGSANMTTGVNFDIMIKTVNNVSGSQRKGAACKAGAARVSAEDPTTCTSRGGTWDTNFDKDIGDVSIISGIINDLGWDAGIPGPRTMAEQMRVVNVFNNVRYCGIMPQFDRDTTPGSPTTEYYPCQTDVSYNYNPASDIYDRRHRVSNVLLGMKSSQAMAIIVGEVTNTQKTIDVMNGSRRINTIIKTVDWLPGEATAALLNYTDAARINTGLVYLTNNLDPNEDIAAQAFVQMIHWGVDLPTAGCAAGARNCPCVSFRGIGPKRLAGVLNTEYGPYLETILTMFGWRNAIPALVCGFGTTQTTTDNCGFLYTGANRNVSANFTTSGTALDGSTCSGATPCQQIAGGIATVTFPRVETLAITQNPTPSGQGANGQTYTHTYSANVAANCQNFLPETSGALGLERATDDIVYRGMRGCMAGIAAATVPAGMTGIWQVLKGQGFVGWLLSNGGTMGTPPLQATANTPRCTDSGETDEWNCIKWGKNDNNGADNIGGNSDDNVSYNRWGNYCSIPGYSTPSTCEAANGRWMPNKNYATCQINPDIHGPR